MSNNNKKFYITTAISYVNGAPHLGHAYEALLTDVMARFKRLDGYDVHFLTGTDEHGEKILKTAYENNIDIHSFIDKNAMQFKEMCIDLNISHDSFIRTSEPRHYEASKALWRKLKENGDIYLGKYEGWYSIREEGYFTEDELTKDLKTGKFISPNGTPVEWVEEESYFFRLSAYGEELLEYFKENPNFIQPQSRMNEVKSFVEGGLRDLSISRHKSRLDWGIPVPDDENHVMYVWLDALTNYITALGYPDIDGDTYKKFWPADYHVIGKDIIRFHAVYWPAFLLSAGIELPKAIFSHGFILMDGTKMSKSLGNVSAPSDLVDLFGLNALRYFLMREIPHGQDGNFAYDQAVQRINADLANGLGNLAQRTLSMIYKNCDGAYPQAGEYNQDDKDLQALSFSKITDMRNHVKSFAFNKALASLQELISAGDGYADSQAPWVLKKENPERMKTVLYVLADAIRCIAIMILPYTPDAANKLLDQMKIPEKERTFDHLSESHAIKSGISIDKPVGVFPRIELPVNNAE